MIRRESLRMHLYRRIGMNKFSRWWLSKFPQYKYFFEYESDYTKDKVRKLPNYIFDRYN